MRRLINPAPNGGVPYQNSDFNDILGHQSSWAPFSRILSDILSWTPDYGDQTKRGLILGGIDVLGLTDSNTKIRVEFNNPIVYINGEALTGSYSGILETNPIWIYEAPVTYDTRVLRDSSVENVIINRTFTFSTSNPGTYSIYLGTYSNLNHLHNSLHQYINTKYDSDFFTKSSFQQTNLPSRSPFEQVTWNRPYISYIGSAYIGDVLPDAGAGRARIINIPDQGTTNYIVNGCITTTYSLTGGNTGNFNNDITYNIFNKFSGSFSIWFQESSSDTQNISFEFSIIKNPNNAAIQTQIAGTVS